MTNRKQKIVTSVLISILCIALCVGTTFAFFADSITNKNNKVVSGTLKVDLQLLNTDGTYTSITKDSDPLFNYNLWEPGYTAVRILKIENKGSLALQWQASFISYEGLSELADVIDVYVITGDTELSYPTKRADVSNWTRKGTLAEVMNTLSFTAVSTLNSYASAYLGIALHMQTTAGNEYQGLDLGTFDISIVATQYTQEEDFFGEDYDESATLPCVHNNKAVGVDSSNNVSVVCADCQTVLIANNGTSPLTFTKTDTEATVTGITEGYEGAVVIPDFYDGVPVTTIANNALNNNANTGGKHTITSVAIPDSVTTIGLNAFYNCNALTTVTFGENSQLTSLGGTQVFEKCSSLESIVIPKGVSEIPEDTFAGCSSLKSVTFAQDSVLTSIARYAFSGCSSLTTITFGGTTAQWADVTVESNAGLSGKTVTCSDGSVTIE